MMDVELERLDASLFLQILQQIKGSNNVAAYCLPTDEEGNSCSKYIDSNGRSTPTYVDCLKRNAYKCPGVGTGSKK